MLPSPVSRKIAGCCSLSSQSLSLAMLIQCAAQNSAGRPHSAKRLSPESLPNLEWHPTFPFARTGARQAQFHQLLHPNSSCQDVPEEPTSVGNIHFGKCVHFPLPSDPCPGAPLRPSHGSVVLLPVSRHPLCLAFICVCCFITSRQNSNLLETANHGLERRGHTKPHPLQLPAQSLLYCDSIKYRGTHEHPSKDLRILS